MWFCLFSLLNNKGKGKIGVWEVARFFLNRSMLCRKDM
jgi:hypothetical protein